MANGERILRFPEVRSRTGLSRSTVYLRVAHGNFPAPVPLGTPRAVGWLESEVDGWIKEQVAAARTEPVAVTA